RTRHQRGRRSPHLRPVLSGCRAKPRRHRPRPCLLQAGRRAARLHHQRRQSWRKRRDHPVHVARSRPRRRGEIAGMFGRILRDAFPLRRGEWGLGLFLYALLTLMVASDWIGKLGADSLFVKRWGVNYVPVMYIVTPIAMLAVSAMIFFFVDRVRRRTLLLWYVAGLTVLSVAFLGGAIGAGIAPLIHAENFIGAQAVGFMVCFVALVVYRGLPEGHGSRLAEERSKGIAASLKDSVDGYRAVASDRMLRTFGVGVFFWYFLMQFGNFLYLVGLDQSTAGTGTGSEDLFSQLYASVYTSSSLVALFIQSV